MAYTELHAHIEGTVPIGTLLSLIKKYPTKDALPGYFSDFQKEIIHHTQQKLESGESDAELLQYLTEHLVLKSPTKTLLEFLKRIPSKFLKYYMRTPEDVQFVITSTLAQYGADYSHIELIFIPNSLENQYIGGDQLTEIFAHTWKQLPDKNRYGFVLSMRRTQHDVSPEYARKVVTDYGKYVDSGITKLDICADEDAVSYIDLRDTLDILATAKQQFTLHIGESTDRDLEYVLDNYPSVKQFNHGIQAAFKPGLIEKILRNDVLLTLCPLSNIYTGVLSENKVIEALQTFRTNGVSYTINSDDATIINGDVYAPYKYLQNKHPDLLLGQAQYPH